MRIVYDQRAMWEAKRIHVKALEGFGSIAMESCHYSLSRDIVASESWLVASDFEMHSHLDTKAVSVCEVLPRLLRQSQLLRCIDFTSKRM